jgi:preprotein translocase subunit SecA
VLTNLKKAYENNGLELVRSYEKSAILVTIDEAWKEHLREMDELKQSVQAAAYEQKDPLLIYKLESFDLFKTMVDTINKEVASLLMKGYIPSQEKSRIQNVQAPKRLDMSKFETKKSEYVQKPGAPPDEQKNQQEQKTQPIRVEKKVGRNDPCPCGSGKKYKHCHGVGA